MTTTKGYIRGGAFGSLVIGVLFLMMGSTNMANSFFILGGVLCFAGGGILP